jgi:hypothetical protein
MPRSVAKQIGLTERIAGENLRGLHHLFLIDDDAVGLFQDRLELGVDVFRLLVAMLARAVGRDVRHRARPIERDERDDVLEPVRLHVEQRAAHALAFQLEDADRFSTRQQVVGFLVVQRDRGQIELDAALL